MYYVYILVNKTNKVMYTGVTNNLQRRLYEHKHKLIPGFTSKYNVDKLVYYACTSDVNEAIAFEKKVKGWSRNKKNALVEQENPQWEELKVD
ncbi:MAG: GIY-YIG nuclease family protein [Clostridia bacterium]|nr:GIY-YIG nuclease family protein [Clostridia bacterium]